jgi:hypothetical protein
MTKRVSILLPLQKLDNDTVAFLLDNIKAHPGNTELLLHIQDDEAGHTVRLKTLTQKVELNDPLIQFLEEGAGGVRYALDLT